MLYNLLLYDQNDYKKTITKERVLVSSCVRPSWWEISFEYVLIVFGRNVNFLRNIIFSLHVFFVIDGDFQYINITFIFFFIYFLRWIYNFSILFGGHLTLIIDKTNFNESKYLEFNDFN
jgi:hypothetical protein